MIKDAKTFYELRTGPNQISASHEEAPLEVWLEIIKIYPSMRFWVAQNKTIPLQILEILASNEDSNIRSMIASKRKLPEKLQLRLAKDPDFSVRERLVCNQKVTMRTLRALLQDPEPKIRSLAKNKIDKT